MRYAASPRSHDPHLCVQGVVAVWPAAPRAVCSSPAYSGGTAAEDLVLSLRRGYFTPLLVKWQHHGEAVP
jgi:hypothetical protein